jgi:hypothetical protein
MPYEQSGYSSTPGLESRGFQRCHLRELTRYRLLQAPGPRREYVRHARFTAGPQLSQRGGLVVRPRLGDSVNGFILSGMQQLIYRPRAGRTGTRLPP